MAAKNICMPFRPAFENSVAVPGAKAVLTLSGTTTLRTVYSNQAMTTAAANPIIANASGRFPQRWFDDSVAVRLRIFAADADITTATPLEDFDPYTPYETGQAATNPNFSVATGAAGTNVILSGTYPNLTLTIPRGTNGSGTVVGDGAYTDITVSGAGTVYTIANAAVTLAKMANLAENRIIGRQSAGAGVPEALIIGVGAGADIPDRDAGDTRWIQRTESLVHSIYIPASAMVAQTTNGAAVATVETGPNDIMYSTLDFDPATIEYAQFQFSMPKSWNEGTVTAQVFWSATNTGDVVWGVQGLAISNDDPTDAAFGSSQLVTDSVTAAGDLMVTAATAAITIGGSPAAEDLVVFRVFRNATSGSDTCAVDAQLLGVKINFTTNAADDS